MPEWEQLNWLDHEYKRLRKTLDLLEWATSTDEENGKKSIDPTVRTLIQLLGDIG